MRTMTLSLITGIFFGSWTFVMRASGISNPFVAAFVVNLVTTLVLLPMAGKELSWKMLCSAGGLAVLAAGVINGLGHAINAKLVVDRTQEMSRFGVIIPAVCVVIGVIGGVALFGEPLGWKKIAGAAIVLIGIALLATK